MWPAADIAVEYDSFLHHGSRAKMADDARRRNDLLARGTTVVSITGRTVWNLIELDEIARLLQGAWASGFPRTESAGEKPSTSFTGC
ncbi:MAG: hypothetical protein ACLSVD_13105 [Eggerthellaceae bacterium]